MDSDSESAARTSWPAVTYEERPWVGSRQGMMSQSQHRAHRGPYNAAVTPEIADRDVELPGDVLASADEATAEIVRFDATVGDSVSPYAPLLLRSESAASSQIENLTASAKAIALAELGDTSRVNASLVVANTGAMQAAIGLADRLDAQAILDMQEKLLGQAHPEWVGTWRDQQVWIGGRPWGPHRAAFVPPHHERVPAAMDDLVAFMQRDDLPALVQAAIAHAQFETIHPFPDGNGRTGRSLVHSLLRAKGTIRSVTVPVSAGLLADVRSYFESLTAYREGHPQAIVEQFTDAAFRAVRNGRLLVEDLRTIRRGWEHRITARRDAVAWRLADLLIRQPVVHSALAQAELGVSAPTANQAIDHLAAVGVLQQIDARQRYRRWVAEEVLIALDMFAARAGRRNPV